MSATAGAESTPSPAGAASGPPGHEPPQEVAAQAVRMAREESVLKARDDLGRYAAYCATVRYRIVPFVF